MRFKEGGQRRAIVQVADDERRVRVHRAAIALAQIVINDDFIAALGQLLHDMAADIAGAAGHQDFHALSPPHGREV